jgi:hypothetical protein
VQYLLLCGWGLCIFLALLGYGKALFRLFGIRTAPWPLAATSGVSLLVGVGGLLNLSGFITLRILALLIILGNLLALYGFWSQIKDLPQQMAKGFLGLAESPKNLALAVLLILLLAVPVLRNVRVRDGYFSHDDLSAYLTIPEETFQLGTLPSDPFNDRRITSGLGAAYFLQTFMLLVGDVRTLPFVDVSVGSILYAAVLFGIFRSFELSLGEALCLMLLMFVAPVFRNNYTMVVLPAALFAALFWIEIHPALGDATHWRRTVLLGFTAAALCALKSTYVPAALLICVFYFVGAFSEQRLRAIGQLTLFFLVAVASLLPWMLDMKRKEATYLFPIFGRGYEASAYGVIPEARGWHGGITSFSMWMWLAIAPLAGPLLLALAIEFVAYKRSMKVEWVALSSVLLGAAIAILALGTSGGGESIGRYSLPFAVPAVIIFAGFVLRWRRAFTTTPLWLKAAVALVVVSIGYDAAGFGVYAGQYRRYAEDAGVAPVPDHFNMELEKKRIAALQASVPSHEPILAHVSVSFPFDFRRNRVFIPDWIGMSGLPPGMPVGKGPEALRKYLLDHAIRYVAYDRRRMLLRDYDPGTSLQTVLANPRMYGRHRLLYILAKVSESEEQSIAALANTCKHVYDDGEIYLLDLAVC